MSTKPGIDLTWLNKKPANRAPLGLNPSDRLKADYNVCQRVLQEYATFLQKKENKKAPEVKEAVRMCAAKMNEKFRFGDKFFSDIDLFVTKQFLTSTEGMRQSIVTASGTAEEVVHSMLAEMEKDGTSMAFTPGFRQIFKF